MIVHCPMSIVHMDTMFAACCVSNVLFPVFAMDFHRTSFAHIRHNSELHQNQLIQKKTASDFV